MNTSKKKNTIYTFGSSFLAILLQGILGFITTKLILTVYGSDFNGVNATANQFINLLMLLEGGITLATNVALFKPIANEDESQINHILAAMSKIFHKIGLVFFVLGIIGSYIYANIIGSELDRIYIFLLFVFTVIPSAFNIYYTSKYSVLLQAEQKEYIIHFINIAIVIVTQSLLILVASLRVHYLYVRIVQMACSILNSLIIVSICKKKHIGLNLDVEPDFLAIKGTKDILIQKFTGLLYGTAPVLYISIFLGAIYVSVYAVYNSIFSLIKNFLYSLVNAPRMSFGVLISQQDSDYVKEKFLQYEFIIISISTIVFISVFIMTAPFIAIYTRGITDVNYADNKVALLLALIGYLEIIHIPSGHIINLSGNFSYSKKFQLIASLILIIVIPLASYFWSLYGVLFGILCTALALCFMEIGYIHQNYFKNALRPILKLLVSNILPAILICFAEYRFLPSISSYFEFFVQGTVILLTNSFLFFGLNYFFNRKYLEALLGGLRRF